MCVLVWETGAHFPIRLSLFTLLMAVRRVFCVCACMCVIVCIVEEASKVLKTIPAPVMQPWPFSYLSLTHHTLDSRDPWAHHVCACLCGLMELLLLTMDGWGGEIVRKGGLATDAKGK